MLKDFIKKQRFSQEIEKNCQKNEILLINTPNLPRLDRDWSWGSSNGMAPKQETRGHSDETAPTKDEW
jgi:hypothetical protein